MLKLIIAEDHSIFVEGLKKTLQDHLADKIQILSIVSDGNKLLDELKFAQPDLLFLDLNLPGSDGLELIKPIHKAFPNMRIIVLTIYQDTKLVREAFKNGVDGYILKSCKTQEILNAIEEVMEGKTFMGEGVAVTDRPDASKQADSIYQDSFMKKYNLTNREMEILKLISNAMTNKQISEELYISDQTVGVHRKNIMRKLGVNSSAGLVRMVHQNNLLH